MRLGREFNSQVRESPSLPLDDDAGIQCMQQWYSMSDPAIGDALYDISTMRLFTGLALDATISDHPFRIITCQLGFTKTRYRGMAKNDNKLAMLFALANIVRVSQMVKHRISASGC